MKTLINNLKFSLYDFFDIWRNNFTARHKKKSINFYLAKEISAIIFLIIGIALFLAIFSFNSDDTTILKTKEQELHNYLGLSGAIIAETLTSFFGMFSLLIPMSFLYLSGRLFFMPALFSYKSMLGANLCTLGLLPLLAIPNKQDSFLLSGILGLSIKKIIVFYTSTIGLYLISFAFIVSGLVLIVSRPFLSHMLVFIPKAYSFLKSKIPKNTKLKEKISMPLAMPAEPLVQKIAISVVPPEKQEIQIVEQKRQNNVKSVIVNEDQTFSLPPLKLLDYDEPSASPVNQELLKKEADKLQKAFLQFGIEGKIREIRTGPVVTNYEFVPAAGIKLSRIASLSDDIAMAMSAVQVRIVTPIPGKGAVGIEVPNEKRETVYLKEIVASEAYALETHKLCMAIGKDVEGKPYFMNLADMPHVLIAGTTGSGKSVSVNAMICSILYRASPKDVRFLMIDPKMLELSIYNGIPHLLLPPIIDAKKAANALKWAVKEMDLRYELMKEAMVRDIDTYNKKITQIDISGLKKVTGKEHEHQPYIVIVVDEYADLLAVAGKDVETYIMRLAQKARACGIHVMLATQRPSVDVITGVIKANFPVRMGFRLASCHDSKTIINKYGAEKLLGRGDALIMPPGTSDVYRVHGAFISEKELLRVIDFWTNQASTNYQEEIAEFSDQEAENITDSSSNNFEDEKLSEAITIIKENKKCSISFLQRHLSVGYNRAAKIVEHMEKQGIVGPVLNSKGDREIFIE